MSNSEKSRISLRSISGPTEFRLLDHKQNTVAHDFGELEKEVSPGLYVLEMNAGSERKREIIKVAAGKDYIQHDIDLPFPSPAPIGGTSTIHEYHGYPALDLSAQATAEFGVGGRLVLFIRSLAESQKDIPGNIDISAVELLTENLVAAGKLSPAWKGDQQNGWQGFSVNLAPGGYVLRFAKRGSWRKNARSSSKAVDQAVWVAEGWTTLVFVPTENSTGLPVNELASVHMVRLGQSFDPYLEEARQANLALEMALSGLRQGRQIIPRNFLDLLLGSKFENPMLGIVGAHALLQAAAPDWKLFDTVVKNLQNLLPMCPDVSALQMIGKNRRGDSSKTEIPPVTFPPMLFPGMKGLVARDAMEPGIVATGSLAEKTAARLFQAGPWSKWDPVSPEELQALPPDSEKNEPFDLQPYLSFLEKLWASEKIKESARIKTYLDNKFETLNLVQVQKRIAETFHMDMEPVLPQTKKVKFAKMQDAAQKIWASLPKEAPTSMRESIRSPEVAAVGDYLEGLLKMAERKDGTIDLSKFNIQDISQYVELPVSSVKRAIKNIASNLGNAWDKGSS